jgi:hypothetical protein
LLNFITPYQSEPWIDGNTDYTGLVIELLETFTQTCNKPSLHFFGHTHAYSRGQSRDHQHLWVNVASAGGRIDSWGDYEQIDYEQFSVSQDEWGFVVVEVEAGDSPSFRLRRISRGNETTPRDNEIRDDVSIYLKNKGPSKPIASEPRGDELSPRCNTFIASEYSDPDFDLHGASHWQLSDDCTTFEDLVDESWVQYENWFMGEDQQAGDDLTDAVMGPLEGGNLYCWRVRYRDRSLAWGEWSDPIAFTTASGTRTENLLQNPGAEEGITGWNVTEGSVESLAQDECGAPAPAEGERFFATGGLCDPTSVGQATQSIALTEWAEVIASGEASAIYGGILSNYNGSDIPEIGLLFLDEQGETIESAGPLSHNKNTWTPVDAETLIPANAHTVEFIIKGTRTNGVDNDASIDALYLYIDDSDNSDCDQGISKAQPEDEQPEETEQAGCGCRSLTSNRTFGFLSLLAGVALLRRPKRYSRRRSA